MDLRNIEELNTGQPTRFKKPFFGAAALEGAAVRTLAAAVMWLLSDTTRSIWPLPLCFTRPHTRPHS